MSSRKNFHTVSCLLSFCLNIAIFSTAFFDIGLTTSLCGPLTIAPRQELFINVTILCIINSHYALAGVIYRFIIRGSRISKSSWMQTLLNSYCAKYVLLFVLKLFIILSQPHRLKYYMVVVMLELLNVLLGLALDFAAHKNMSEVIDAVFMDLLTKTTVFYELNRTFCPTFALYWFISNLLVLLVSQLQSHLEGSPDYFNPMFESALYVKQDTQRFIAFTGLYFAIFSLVQIETYGYGMLLTFLGSLLPFYMAVRFLDQDRSAMSILCLCLVGLTLIVLICTREKSPHLFQPLYGSWEKSVLEPIQIRSCTQPPFCRQPFCSTTDILL